MSQRHQRHNEAKGLYHSYSKDKQKTSPAESLNVTAVNQEDPLTRLETLVTRLAVIKVTPSSLASDVCDTCDSQKMVPTVVNCLRVYQWFETALTQGHIEVSQPLIGRIAGWPVRPIRFSGLWTDYLCWNSKQGIDVDHFTEREQFRSICSYVFDVGRDDTVNFPPLPICRAKFDKWRRTHEPT